MVVVVVEAQVQQRVPMAMRVILSLGHPFGGTAMNNSFGEMNRPWVCSVYAIYSLMMDQDRCMWVWKMDPDIAWYMFLNEMMMIGNSMRKGRSLNR
jgi:hypothetical protein